MNIDENDPLLPQSSDADKDGDPSLEKAPAEYATHLTSEYVAEYFPRPTRIALPEDLRAPWGWSDLLLFMVFAVAGTFLLSILLAFVFAEFGVSLSHLRQSASEQGLLAILSQALLFFCLLGYLAAQMTLRFRAPFWRTIGWRPLEPGSAPRGFRYLGFIAGGFLLALMIQIFSGLFPTKNALPVEALFQDRRTAFLLLLMAVLIAPVVEETIFRGYIYPVVARSFGVGAGVVATGTLFGLLHAPQLWGGWMQIVLLVVVGIIFTYVRAVTRTVLASYLLHLSYNFFISVAFVVGSHWLRVLTPPG